MISVRRQLSEALLHFTGIQVQFPNGQYEPDSRAHNMVVSSRSSRGRRNVQTSADLGQHENEQDQSASSSPQSVTRSNDASLLNLEHDDASSSRSKRSRVTSVSDNGSIQKRRRLERNPDLPHVHIPLRGRTAPKPLSYTTQNNVTHDFAGRPPLLTQESSISNTSLNSPSYRPQYDQFKRIEEKAQRVAKKQLQNESSKDDKRTLRSEHGSTRSKTELAQYFPSFDDMLSLEPADPDVLVAKTPVVLLNDTPSFEPSPCQPDFFRTGQPPFGTQIVQLDQYSTADHEEVDPLSDDVYLKAHHKAERHEKQMKNGDKERAQHEKYQLERLLEELKGPDWLKTLGISGITDTEKKRYEVKRLLFMKETKALIDKFRRWKEEEKRRKSEKQQRLVDEVEATQTPDQNETILVTSTRKPRARRGAKNSRDGSRTVSRAVSDSGDEAPDSRELDNLASQQLQEEAKLATLKSRKPLTQTSLHHYMMSVSVRKPFTSFFEKEHIRDAVMSGRNRGRKSYAFGIEVPDLAEQEFELPDGILTEDTIRASQRMRRRQRRSLED